MRNSIISLALFGGIVLLGSQTLAAVDCSGPDFQSVRDDILASCGGDSCSTNNHGHFVSCVAHKVKDAVDDGLIATNCKGKVVRCGARSTCGKKEGFVTCAICDPGTCSTEGFCDDGTTPCTDSSECPGVVRRCSTKSDASRCVAPPSSAPGTTAVVGSGSCCAAACPIPE